MIPKYFHKHLKACLNQSELYREKDKVVLIPKTSKMLDLILHLVEAVILEVYIFLIVRFFQFIETL